MSEGELIMRYQKKPSGHPFPVFPLLLSVELLSVILLSVYSMNNSAAAGKDSPVFFIFALLSSGLSAALLLYYFFSFRKALKKADSEGERLIGKELKSLSIAISDFARGNLAVHAKSYTEETGSAQAIKPAVLSCTYRRIRDIVSEEIQDFNSVTAAPCKRLCYVGADNYREGEQCGEVMGELLHGTGNIAILLKDLINTGQNLRRKGFKNKCALAFPDIKIVEVGFVNESIDTCREVTAELLQKYPGLNGIDICEGTSPSGAAKAVEEAGKTGAVIIVTHDLADPTMHCLERGVIQATLSQSPYMQGFDPVVRLYNQLSGGAHSALNRILTPMSVITKENYREYWHPQKGVLLSENEKRSLCVPVENTGRKALRIAVVLPDDTLFWQPVAAGAQEAAKLLSAYNTQVDIVIPAEIKQGDWSVKRFETVLRQITDGKADAVALPVFDRALTPFLNDLNDGGVLIATFNAEPINFRGMFNAVANHAKKLYSLSEELSTGSHDSNIATSQVSDAMKVILSGAAKQIELLASINESLDSLNTRIDGMIERSAESVRAAQDTTAKANVGEEIVEKTSVSMKIMQNSSTATTRAMESLAAETLKIGEIVTFIEDLSSQTELLAINASIQAARAGEHGKAFSVVAGEIRNLSDRSKKATEDISLLVKTILERVYQASETMNEGLNEAKESFSMFGETGTALSNIKISSLENDRKIHEMITVFEEMKSTAAEIRRSMSTLTQVNSGNGSAVERINESIEQLGLRTDRLTRLSESLSDMADAQEMQLGQFLFNE